ncbi:MAG: SpoIIE family protein phosphatase [Ignavibacteria bacterium]|jgi:sigma-B regulation protein RsbU (phosphoserine phosphatase)
MFITKKTLAAKLSKYILSVMILMSVLIFSVFYFVSRNLILESVQENAKNITEKTVNKIETVLLATTKIPQNLAYVLETTEFDEKRLLALMKTVVENNEEIFGTAVAFEPYSFKKDLYYYSPYMYRDSANVNFVQLGNPDYEYFFQDWYQVPKHIDSPYWTEPYYDEGGGEILMATYSVPFYKYKNGKKTFWGIITIDIDLEWLQEIVSSVKIFGSGFAFLISKTGTIVTHPNNNFIMNQSIFSLAEEYKRDNLSELGRSMIKGESGFSHIKSIMLGKHSWIYYSPLLVNNWSLAVVFPENELYAGLYSLTVTLVVIGFFGILILLSVIVYVAKKLTAPLHAFAEATKDIGTGNFDVKLPEIKSSDEIGKLHDSFEYMLDKLHHYIEDLKETTSAKEKIESELRIAHEIQMGMIPKIFPPFPEREDIDLHAVLKPAREVGGDLYDFFFIEENKLCFAIGDVSGKGVPASLFMAVTITLLRSKAVKNVSTGKIVDEINKALIKDNTSQMFVTFFIGILDLRTGEFEYTNAGHNFPYIIKKNNDIIELKSEPKMALALFDIKPYDSLKTQIDEGDKLVLYTDGINEAMDTNNNQFDYKRFKKSLQKLDNKDSSESTDSILNDLKEFTKDAEQSDDITLLIVNLKKINAVSAKLDI